MKMLKEFRDFIMTGNVIDLAVAVILAGAIGLVINGFVKDIMMPFIGHFSNGVDFSDLKYILDSEVGVKGEEGYKPENAILYGKWITTIINLVTVGIVLFLIVKSYNKLRKPKAEPAPAGPTEKDLLVEIRDLLAKK